MSTPLVESARTGQTAPRFLFDWPAAAIDRPANRLVGALADAENATAALAHASVLPAETIRLAESRHAWVSFLWSELVDETRGPDPTPGAPSGVTDWFRITSCLWTVFATVDRSLTTIHGPSAEADETEPESTLQELAETFWRFEKVRAVYVQRYEREVQVSVAICGDRYDGDLMDALLDAEYSFVRRHPETYYAFSYPPVGMIARPDFMHPAARPLFVKQTEPSRGGLRDSSPSSRP